MWRRLAPPRTKEFFAKLDWMQGGTDLWKYLEPLSPAILTGSPSGDWAGPQKVRWCQKNLQLSANRVLVVDPCDKALFSHPGAILVDDRAEYRADWEARGGIFVHFKEATVRAPETPKPKMVPCAGWAALKSTRYMLLGSN
ncbi:unnamed protein product [Durusdinium trenchii]|uniref:Uncharacterized protein n=2 Tax=Durusdinium trenchii TaxID=1381693 RepID=A0ABP0J8U4_9DINO